jgi:hypothetical protein
MILGKGRPLSFEQLTPCEALHGRRKSSRRTDSVRVHTPISQPTTLTSLDCRFVFLLSVDLAINFVSRGTLVVTIMALSVGAGHSQMPATRTPVVVQATPLWMWPYDPALIPYWGIWYSPCYPFASCAASQQFRLQERRRERLEEFRREQPPAPALGLDAQRGFGIYPGQGHVPPTSDADVQPDYLGSGRIRDEHHRSGEYLPDFLNGKARPSR